MPIIDDPKLYKSVKKDADKLFEKSSAYKSGWIVKTYKEKGGTYTDDGKDKPLKRWFKEEWEDIGGQKYPVFRPTKRVSKKTPLTASEIDPEHAKKQIALKQEIKGDSNLPPFNPLDELVDPNVRNRLKRGLVNQYSNPEQALKNARKYLGNEVQLYISNKTDKKYMIQDPDKNWVHFGQIGYEDFTKHGDEKRRQSYLKRTANMRGNWRDNPYSANNLARNILW
jgi:hypothetical protein